MHEIKKKLMDELYKIEDKMKTSGGGKLNAGDIEYLHKLTDTVKNIDKIELLEEGDYSEAANFMGDGRMYGTSYARGRGRNAKRDSMGRYSRDGGNFYNDGMSYEGEMSERGGQGGNRGGRGGNYSRRGGYSYGDAKEEMIEKAEEMMGMAENEQQRKMVERFMQQLEQA